MELKKINKVESLQKIRLKVSESGAGKVYKALPISGQIISLGIVILIFSIGTGGQYLHPSNFKTILGLAAIPMILALAVHQVIILGAMDLSLEGVVAITAVASGIFLRNSVNANDVGFWIIPIVLIVGGLAGLTNGLLNTKLRMPSFISTLGMSWTLFGFAIMISKGSSIPLRDTRFQKVLIANFLGIPVVFLIALALGLILYFIQRKTKLGKHMYAIGGNEVLAKQAGVKVDTVKITVFAITGMIYGLAGLMLVARLNSSAARYGNNLLFPAMTAVAVGGVSLSGGVGGALNAILGTIIVVALNNGLVFMQINPYMQSAVNGIVLICAVALTIDRDKIGIIK
ncbi:MAG: ABC transporter permease [Spirochaetia bacterium]|nr:ABC transporter permease [Spirochaetia bacterium]